jgi:hypothetical protein
VKTRSRAFICWWQAKQVFTAIIAGVCLLIQHLRRLTGAASLPPLAVRDILRDINNGTASAAPSTDRIGAMPDFQKIIASQGL